MNAQKPHVIFFDIGNTLGRVRVSPSGDRIESIELFAGVAGDLSELRQGGARLGIISNRGRVSEPEVRSALERADLIRFFDAAPIVLGPKDSPEIFRQAAMLAASEPRDCMFVGENEEERERAVQAGMKVAASPADAARELRTGTPDDGPETDADALRAKLRDNFDAVLAIIRKHGKELLAIPGVVSVRPGYRFKCGRLIDERVVSVSVLEKRREAEMVPEGELLPARLGNVGVDVVPATPAEQLRYFGVEGFAAADASGTTGGLIETRLPGDDEPEFDAAFAPLQPYVPPGEALDPVEEEMEIVCHASPDAGWRNLRGFLLGTNERLTLTMYEFTARHVLDTLVEALNGDRLMNFILDAGHQDTSGNDVSKDEVIQVLSGALDERLRFVWAAVADDSVTSAAFFKNAYHIKVAVRDGGSFWLSSGNFKRSGQPTIDPIHGPLPPNFNPRRFQSRSNREWNVIVRSPGLASLMETYITHDIDQAEPLQVPGLAPSFRAPLPDLFVPTALVQSFDAEAEPRFFEERIVRKHLRVQPLLTPDNYLRHILPLIEGASEKLYFQNQSLKPNTSNAHYMRVFRALRDKSLDDNIDVRIIVRGDFNPDNILAALNAHGFEMSRVRLQNGNHNKGVLVDDHLTVVGSHNWTGDGTTMNRDASLIFDDDEINQYYTQLFLYDWDNLARSGDETLLAMPRLAPPNAPMPPGMERVPWQEFFAE